MSFSGEVKKELAKRVSPARHCQIAELAALMNFCGVYGAVGPYSRHGAAEWPYYHERCCAHGMTTSYHGKNEGAESVFTLGFQTENEAVVRKGFTLLKKTYNIDTGTALNEREIQELLAKVGDLDRPVSPLLLKSACCRRAFLRGAFLAVGSMSDPAKGYHLEFDCSDAARAGQLQELIRGFGIESKVILRKKYHVVYLKEGSAIVDLLNVFEAPVSLMNLENLRILKEMRNSVNRRVNCETANIAKTVNAAARQVEDIEYLGEHYGFQNLPESLREMAEIRLEYPDMPLKELGEHFNPPLGKSGVNHRLRKLSELAEKIRP